MALHGMAEITLGVPDVAATEAFYNEFGLTTSAPGVLATKDGGDQLRLVQRSYRHLVEYTLAADDADDLSRISANAAAHDLPVASNADGSITIVDPICGISARVAVRPRLSIPSYESPTMNTPGHTARLNDRAPAIFDHGKAAPRKLGHVLYATPDLAAQGALLARTAELVDQGRLRSTVAACLGPICTENLIGAHRRLADGHSIGKLVLEGWP